MKQVMILALGYFMLLAACKSANVNKTQSGQTDNSGIEKLNGTWELEYISGPRIAFHGLYPDRKPVITFVPPTAVSAEIQAVMLSAEN